MIEPQVVHGGASSWYFMAANWFGDGTITPTELDSIAPPNFTGA